MKAFNSLCLLCALLMGVSSAQADVVNFDDLNTAPTGSVFVISPYQGFIWGAINNPAFTAINDAHWTGAGNYNNSPGAPSAPNGVLNSGIVNITRQDGSAFNFEGAYFSPFTSNNDMGSQASTAIELFVEGYNGVNLIGSSSLSFSAPGYIWLQADILGVTSLKIFGTSPLVEPFQTRWAMDDFTYNQNVTQVPIPSAFWLLTSALASLGMIRKRFNPKI